MKFRTQPSAKEKAGLYALGSVFFLFLIPISFLIAIGIFDILVFGNQSLTIGLAAGLSLLSAAYGLWFTLKAVRQLLFHSRLVTGHAPKTKNDWDA